MQNKSLFFKYHFPKPLKWQSLLILALLFGFFLSNTATVLAIPMVLHSQYTRSDNNPSFTIATEAFFDTVALTGSGTEEVQVTAFNLKFSDRSFSQSAQIFLATPPWPEKTIVAIYQNGIFDYTRSIDRGGNPSVAISPPANWLGENVRLTRNVLFDTPCCSGFVRYNLDIYSSPIPVGATIPEPTTLILMGSGLIGIFFIRKKIK